MSIDTRVSPPPPGSGATLRRWRDLDDIDGMVQANTRLRDHLGLLEAVDGEAMRFRYTHLVNSDPATDCVLVERDGETRGYARAEWHDLLAGQRVYTFTLVLEPASWGLGLTEAMLEWCEARADEMAGEHPSDLPAHLQGYAFDGDEAAVGALLGAGYEPVRWDVEMLRPDLDDLPPVLAPEGYAIRPPRETELHAVFDMMVLAFAEHWGGVGPDEWRMDEWTDDPRFRREHVVVAWAGDTPASVVTNLIEPGPGGSTRGLLDAVATHPDHRRRGLARACVARSLELLRAQGAASAYLGVDTENHNQALDLYESCGFHVVSRSATYQKSLPAQEADA
jgi:ribosomal protein S18 acetylase RimI-like enzyme